MPDVEVISAKCLNGVAHGFLGRGGGVSEGTASGLDVGFGGPDDGEAAARNRQIAIDAVLPGADLAMVEQIHSAKAVIVDGPVSSAQRQQADALVTDRAGLLLGIVTADCAPVLFADTEAGVIGAAHAGWRGAHGGVVEAAVEAMERIGGDRKRIRAAIGPCIVQPSYEVDGDFRTQFEPGDSQFFAAGRAGRWQFDLSGYVHGRLQSAGIGEIEAVGLDTYAEPDRFFSFRRATHRGEANYGRQFSLIGMPSTG
ncbi:peptidoglycan editing factor PgeF [Altererythrobacter luteolus]|uniref:Purine nucleoside phosphorylase n=1 Tax=Pontixanthobacter luteolus TaxID=295089 RepID=A0A6I4V6T8_9SPHN|nr:peptidoglycan editing factor PgeF [Pontixanthobacter luteolus]MXP48004.1 peptidoglycan editing factor PgeF [Pontixanthobacter luteolus]